ncbi:C40 family peptidase [Microtetraspora malaysiensis]|uniref:C40 family peptidase n=1 Tax=Microtetraspora malaysiensis TaxID=161358 RepID=UPI000A0787F9|nr:C40 family peptidase [Microtetraspora malaysiensis]
MVLDRRARSSFRTSVARVVSETRQDLAYRPRMARRRRMPRAAVPIIGALLVSVFTADLVVLSRDPGTPPPVRREATRAGAEERGRHVASAEQVKETTPAVTPLKKLRDPHLFVVARTSLSPAVVAKVRAVKGVVAAEVTDAADVMMDGKRVQTLGVDPSTFRPFTPKTTAKADALWNNIAAGEVAVSFDLGQDGGIKLGSTVPAGGRHRLRVGAYATMGMGSIAAVVSRPTARSLGIPEGNALVLSAPKIDSGKLRKVLRKILPKGSQVAAINPVVVLPPGRTTSQKTWPVSAFMSVDQLKVALQAAVSKLGRPYVWGAEGPNSFDCSGLVQWAYRQAGVRMPRVTHQQWATGPQVPLSQAQPGDLLFWRNDPTNPNYISHVAIYWGNGKMLNAPRTGDVVKIAPIYTRNLAGVVRVSPWVAARVR